MKSTKFFKWIFASALFLAVASCDKSNDIIDEEITSYNGIIITNEGSFNKPDASIDFAAYDLSSSKSDIYKITNNENLGDVLQSLTFWGNNAFLVLNNSNKIVVADRYTFKKTTEVTSNLVNPRYLAVSGNEYFVTNNDFFSTYKLNIYKTDNTFVTSISFDRYAEKVVEAGGNIVVQTDGSLYNFTTGSMDITGHTITIVKPSTNAVDKVVTLPDSGEIMDLISYQGYAYALSATSTNSYIYKINPADGTFTATTLTGIGTAQKLRIDAGSFYFVDGLNNIYSKSMSNSSPASKIFTVAASSLYGFNVIDGRIFVSDANYTGNSKVYVYNASTGSQIKSFESGIATNGFYKN